jgi:hypothetical protein
MILLLIIAQYQFGRDFHGNMRIVLGMFCAPLEAFDCPSSDLRWLQINRCGTRMKSCQDLYFIIARDDINIFARQDSLA